MAGGGTGGILGPRNPASARQSSFDAGKASSGVGSFIANELLGIDDMKNAYQHARAGNWAGVAKSGLAIGAELGGTLAAGAAIGLSGGFATPGVAAAYAAKQGVKQGAKELVEQGAKTAVVKYPAAVSQLVTAGGGRGGRFVDDFVDLAPAPKVNPKVNPKIDPKTPKPKIEPIKIPDPKTPKPKIEPIKIPDPKKAPIKPLSPNPPVKPGTYPPYRPGKPSPVPPAPRPPLPSPPRTPLPAPPRPTPQPGPQPKPEPGTAPKSPWLSRPGASFPDASPLINFGAAATTVLNPNIFINPGASNTPPNGSGNGTSDGTPPPGNIPPVKPPNTKKPPKDLDLDINISKQDVKLQRIA